MNDVYIYLSHRLSFQSDKLYMCVLVGYAKPQLPIIGNSQLTHCAQIIYHHIRTHVAAPQHVHMLLYMYALSQAHYCLVDSK